jgi:hypothetical protein
MTDSAAFFADLLKSTSDSPVGVFEHWPAPEQHGPLRRYDISMRCLSTFTSPGKKNTCRSPTFYKLYGIPTCMTHALLEMNERLYQHENV